MLAQLNYIIPTSDHHETSASGFFGLVLDLVVLFPANGADEINSVLRFLVDGDGVCSFVAWSS
jgi:hypothetical protein